jgi:hypothetical protein
MRKKDREPAVSDDEDMIPSRGAFRPVTLSQGIVATRDDLKVREARVKKLRREVCLRPDTLACQSLHAPKWLISRWPLCRVAATGTAP